MERRILSLAIPALAALLVEPLYNLTDTAIVGRLGRTPLGALAVATAVLNVVVAGSGFLSMATTPRIAYLRGRGSATGDASGAAYCIAASLGVALGLVILAGASPLAALAGAHGATHRQAVVYLRIAAAGLPFVLFMSAGTGHLRGLANTRTPLYIVLASNVVNVAAELFLVDVVHAGIAGSAVGTVLAQVVGAAGFVAVAGPRWWVSSAAELRRLLAAAWVLVLRTLALLAAWSGSTAVASRLGPAALGGHQIALQVWFLVALSLDSLAVPAEILVGEALGASGPAEAERVARVVVRVGLVAAIGLGAAMAAVSTVVPTAFSTDHAIRHQATLALLVGATALPLAALAFELDGVLLGSGDIRYLRRTMFAALAGFLPVAGLTLADHRLGITGIWVAIAVWMGMRAGMLTRRWQSGRWLGLAGGVAG